MPALHERIRYARVLARVSQTTLAHKVGVQRSAVAQWERKDGSHPSMEHLAAVALSTGVCLEWLGTGRGPAKPEMDTWAGSMLHADYAQDDLETECLGSLRKLPLPLRKQLISIISLLSNNY